MKMDSLDSLTYGGVRGRENLFNFPSYSIYIRNIHSINRAESADERRMRRIRNVRIKNNGGIQHKRTNESQKT